VVARQFGRSDGLDAFLIALLVPSICMVLATGAFSSALTPIFVETRQRRGVEAVRPLFSQMTLVSLLVLACIALGLGILAPYYLRFLASGFGAAKLQLTRNLLYCLLPCLVFGGFVGCASAMLNAGENFALPAITPVITPLATILIIVTGPRSWGSFLLAAGFAGGCLLEAVVLWWTLRIHRLQPEWRRFALNSEVQQVLRQYVPILSGMFLMGSTGIVDQSMAAMLSPGSVSALGYANKIVSVIQGIGYTSLATSSFPYISKMVAENDWAGCRRTLRWYSGLVFAVTLPIVICLIAFSKPLVRILFQRGAFSIADSELVSRVQICYSFQVPFYIGVAPFVRLLASMRRNDILMGVSALTLSLDVILNLILMRIWGVAGIALSTSAVGILAVLLCALSSFRLIHQQHLRGAEAVTSPGELAETSPGLQR
jgi:putative peptidoglycan lipid II flippase